MSVRKTLLKFCNGTRSGIHETSKRVAANTLTLCLGMLITYYAVAVLGHGDMDDEPNIMDLLFF